jgi:hypothetical protein
MVIGKQEWAFPFYGHTLIISVQMIDSLRHQKYSYSLTH